MRVGLFQSLALSLLLLPGIAAADGDNHFNQGLHGDYAFTGEAACIRSETGFDPVTLSPVLPGNPDTPLPIAYSYSAEGIRTFNGDGTGTIQVHTLSVVPLFFGWTDTAGVLVQGKEVNAGGASSMDLTADFTYQLGADGTITTQVPGDFTGTVLTGARAGETVTVSGFPDLTGVVTDHGKVITLTTEVPSVETETFATTALGQPAGVTFFDICHRSRTLFKIDTQDHQ